MNELICGEVIWTSDSDPLKGSIALPAQLGKPKPDQLQGTPLEQLCELSGRTCYDSLGRGRGSKDYHAHIREVDHFSIYEHANVTVQVIVDDPGELASLLLSFTNRPHLHVVLGSHRSLEVTLNLRHILEWETKGDAMAGLVSEAGKRFFAGMLKAVRPLAPEILSETHTKCDEPLEVAVCLPLQANQQSISCYMSGSRGWSHEQVRHRHAMSQRSSRYCDESESAWVWHPLLNRLHLDQVAVTLDSKQATKVRNALRVCEQLAKDTYDDAVTLLEKDLVKQGIESATARKQARGAARGVLGNALATEMVYTAPVNAWLFMYYSRCTVFADAEIRLLFADLLPKLKKTSLGVWFGNLNLVPSPDGVGEVLSEESMKWLRTCCGLRAK